MLYRLRELIVLHYSIFFAKRPDDTQKSKVTSSFLNTHDKKFDEPKFQQIFVGVLGSMLNSECVEANY